MSQPFGTSDQLRRVLLIDDSELDRRLVRYRLGVENLELIEAPDGRLGLEICRREPPDLVLLDLGLPDSDGFEVLRQLKNEPRTSSVPVILLSASTLSADKARGLDLGAVDFVSKPFDPIELRARIRVALRTKFLQDLLEQKAHLDGLTGLANRMALEERLICEWAAVQRQGGSLAVWIADIDHFKRVNDEYGHTAGDEVLRRAGHTLRSVVRASDFVARYGGEEFVVIAPRCDQSNALSRAEQFRAKLERTAIPFDKSLIEVTASVGVAAVPEVSSPGPLDLLVHADRALYDAKAAGRNIVKTWHCAMGLTTAMNGHGSILGNGKVVASA
ncbi:MAG: diguanylate cyclase [Isosphaeraceae bacterium]|nr:diguanylate cyclase [Isosphaeraceae bacterium]